MPTTVTPVLSSAVGYVSDVRDQVSSLLRFLIMNPGRTSSLWEDKLLSFRKLAAQYENDRDEFAKLLSNEISSKLTAMFHDYTFQVDVTAEDYEEDVSDGRYTLVFSIFILSSSDDGTTEKIPALLSGNISISSDNDIQLSYNNTLDNLTLQSKSSI